MGLYLHIQEELKKSIRGNYQFFEMDQNRIGGIIHQLNKSGFGEHIYCVLCGRITPDQKRIVRERSKVDTQLFIAIMTWFVEQSGQATLQFQINALDHF